MSLQPFRRFVYAIDGIRDFHISGGQPVPGSRTTWGRYSHGIEAGCVAFLVILSNRVIRVLTGKEVAVFSVNLPLLVCQH